jgi:uncharacterized protein
MQKPYPSPFLAVCLLLAGCSTYTQSTNQTADNRRSGRVELVAQETAALAQKHLDDRDTIVYHLEAGSAERALALAKLAPPAPPVGKDPAPVTGVAPTPSASEGAYERAAKFFASADDKIDDYEEKAKHSVSASISSAVVNPATSPYRGQAYDKVMASTYQALNFLAIGDPERARASLNKAYKRQKDAVAENEKRIERDQEKIEAAKNGTLTDEKGKTASSGIDVDRSQKDPKVASALDNLNAGLDARTKTYADYVNPFTTFLDGLFMMTNSTDAQEKERAAKEFARVASIAEDNPYLREDTLLAEDLAKGNTMPKLTYVIFESGEAPHKEELLIPVPLFLFTANEILYTQVPLSRLVFNDQFNPALTITTGGAQTATATVCGMDSVIAKDFKNALPSMWLNALLCASTKAIIQHELNKSIDKNATGYGALFAKLAVAVTSVATTRADTRSWRALPKTFSYARLSTPDDKTITLSTPDGQNAQVTLPDAQVAVVYVKQTQPGTPLLVDYFKLR